MEVYANGRFSGIITAHHFLSPYCIVCCVMSQPDSQVSECNAKEIKMTDDMVATRMAARRNNDARETAITGVES